MTIKKAGLTISVCISFGLLLFTFSSQAAPFKYVGVKDCTMCHKKESVGAQIEKWTESKHAKAFEILGSAEAVKIGKQAGLKGNPNQSPECLVCHTTAFGIDSKLLDKKFNVADGVQCEGCHGPGEKYSSKKEFKDLLQLKTDLSKAQKESAEYKTLVANIQAERTKLAGIGLVQPNEKMCRSCHAPQIVFQGKTYKNPSWNAGKDFNFAESMKKIAHPRTQY
ncbi:MAG: hypothetical protein HQM13_13490 [SAR324 cluster bacterium]|nr:hypothetical protein [SAR324 cluster bacterium]